MLQESLSQFSFRIAVDKDLWTEASCIISYSRYVVAHYSVGYTISYYSTCMTFVLSITYIGLTDSLYIHKHMHASAHKQHTHTHTQYSPYHTGCSFTDPPINSAVGNVCRSPLSCCVAAQICLHNGHFLITIAAMKTWTTIRVKENKLQLPWYKWLPNLPC